MVVTEMIPLLISPAVIIYKESTHYLSHSGYNLLEGVESMTNTVTQMSDRSFSQSEWALRVDLAAAFRLAVHFGWHESVANHFSAVTSEDGKTFLLNPRWKHFATIKASDLLKLDSEDEEVMVREDAPDPSAWGLPGSIHRLVPDAKVLLHCHPPYATALCGLKDPSIKPIDQNTARFFERMEIDLDFGGLASEEGEGERLARGVRRHSVMIMGNHGVAVVGSTVAEAFEDLYYLERAAQTMVLAYSTGQALNLMDDELARTVAKGWDAYREGLAEGHFSYLKTMLDQTDSSWRE